MLCRALPVNPGLLSEQGSEGNNRWFRQFREFHSRQSSISTSLRDPFIRKSEMADPEIMAINAQYISGEKRRRVRKKEAKIPLPEPVIALLKDDAKEKYLASLAPMEVDEDSSSPLAPAPPPTSSYPPQSPPSPSPDLDPQPGSSGTQQHDSAPAEVEEEENDIDLDDPDPEQLQQFLDDLVIVNPPSDDDDDDEADVPSSGTKRPAEDEEMDTSLGVLALKKKSKSPRKKVEKIRILDDSDAEMEEN